MYTVTNGKRLVRLADDTQLDAFLKSGWTLAGEKEAPAPDEAALREEAKALGLRVAYNATAATIRKKIEEHKAGV